MADVAKEFTLRSRVLFIDSSVYFSNNFQFLTKDLESLTRLLEADQVGLLFTSVTVAEIKRHFKEQAKEAASAAQSFHQKAKILRNISAYSDSIMFEKVSATDVENELVRGFDKFLSTKNIKILTVDSISADDVFERYFSVRPPFSVKKPNEFRDAFVLETLRDHATNCNVRIHVVSNDRDMDDYCQEDQYLYYSDSLGPILNAIVHSSRTAPAAFADLAYAAIRDEMFDAIKEFLAEKDFGVVDGVENRIQGYQASIQNLSDVNKRVFSADHNFAKYGVDFEFDVVAEYFQGELEDESMITSKRIAEVYKYTKRFKKVVEVVLKLDFFEGDVSSVELIDYDMDLLGSDILWDYECEEVTKVKAFEF